MYCILRWLLDFCLPDVKRLVFVTCDTIFKKWHPLLFSANLNLLLLKVVQQHTPYPEKMEPIAFQANFDEHKYTVIIFARNVAKVMRNQTSTTNVRRT